MYYQTHIKWPGCAALIVCCFMLLFSCGKEKEPVAEIPQTDAPLANAAEVSPQISEYISAFTAGEISRKSTIVIQFAEEIASAGNFGKAAGDIPVEFQPALKGTWAWKDKRTLEFTPAASLTPKKSYSVSADLNKLFGEAPVEIEDFNFNFRVMPTVLKIELETLQAMSNDDLRQQKLAGYIRSSDVVEPEMIKELLQVKYRQNTYVIKWDHSEDGKTHSFTVENIERKKTPYDLTVSWNGGDLQKDFKGRERVTVSPLATFKYLLARAVTNPQRHIELQFSDPLLKGQDLTGLVHSGNEAFNFVVDGNRVKIYGAESPAQLAGTMVVSIEPGIRNVAGDKIDQRSQVDVTFEEIKPSVELVGNGVIAPSSNQIPFPFKAVNLSAVDIQVIKIFEKNIHQFLQINTLPQTNELYRVGQVVLQKKIDLDPQNELDLKNWNHFSLDLTDMIRMEPGAIYQVRIGYRHSYSLFACSESVEVKDRTPFEPIAAPHERSAWDNWSYQHSNWRHRDNPCYPDYYGTFRTVKRNVLASDLGLIAKRGEYGDMLIVVTDLATTDPIAGATLELYDFRSQLIETVQSDADGFARIETEEVPFLLVARSGDQNGYLKLQDGVALSMSRFETGGTKLFKGVKGYIYGERGVWRPGDTIYLTFVLEDKDDVLPADHPVTMEFYDPRGQLVEKRVSNDPVGDFHAFHMKTAEDAPTGTYQAKVSVGNATFNRDVKVETIMPNRLKINFELDKEYVTVADKSVRGKLEVTWLHGAIAKNLDTQIEATIRPSAFKPGKYSGFTFDNPAAQYATHTEEVFSGQLNESGLASFPIDIRANKNAPGQLAASLKCKVFEPGGNFSVDQFSVTYHPYSTYVGLKTPKGDKERGMLLTDVDHPIEIVTVKPDGNPVARQGLQVALYKLSWKWWWDQSANQVNNYNVRSLKQAIAKGKVDTNSKGEGVWQLNVAYPQWGRYLIQVCDPDGHCSSKIIYIDWPGWAGRAQDEQPGGAAMLTFTADKDDYQVGDDVTLMIPSSDQGRALVSIESGSEILYAWWTDVESGMTRFSFDATAEMAPNVYAHVSLLQPYAQTGNDRPIRLYGVIPISVEDAATRLEPVLEMPDVLQPEQEVFIKVREKEGRPMTYTLAVVDEGLLGLTRFKTPNPWNRFFAKQALNVKSWDVYNDVIGLTGREFDRLLSIGGDGEAGADAEGGNKVNRFKPVVEFLGPFQSDGSTQEHRVKLPLYVGAVKTMVVAGQDGAFGSAEKSTPVRKPLMLAGSLPRVLGPGEEVEYFLSTFAMEDHVKNVEVSVQAGDQLTAAGKTSQSIRFRETGDQTISFPFEVAPATGTVSLMAKAVSGSETAEYNIDVKVRNPNPPVTDVLAKVLEPGETWDFLPKPVGLPGTNSGVVEVSSLPPLNLAGRLGYLLRYPHGCLEQTTSAAFPQLYLSNVLQLTEAQKKDVRNHISVAIDKIYRFQNPSGSLSYWPGALYTNNWSAIYAGHFMLEAKQAGYGLPPDFLTKWTQWQVKAANDWVHVRNRRMTVQAYRLFLLAKAGAPQLGAMNRFREILNLSTVDKWLVAASYHLAGQQEVAKELVRGQNVMVADYRGTSQTFGSSLRDKAIILEAMNVMKMTEPAFGVFEEIASAMGSKKHFHTQTAGFCLLAAGKYLGTRDDDLKYSMQLNDQRRVEIEREKPVDQIDLQMDEHNNPKVSLSNTSESKLFVKTVLSGTPAVGDTTDASNGIQLSLEYMDMEGQLIDPSSLEQGTDFYVAARVTNKTNREQQELALSQIFPSGWEIYNARLGGITVDGSSQPIYQDLRDDRVYTYFNLKPGERKKFITVLNASYRGRFYLPTVYVEAMYDSEVNARRHGQWVEVVKAQ